MQSLCDIALVMLVSGVLGGLVNYFISDPQDERRLTWWQHIFVGVTAAFMVPLLLNMISADLIDKIRGVNGQPGDYSKLFVLAGFCLVAAVSSRAFIKTMSERVLQEVRSAKKNAEEAKEDAAEAKAAVAPFVEEEISENEIDKKDLPETPEVDLTEPEKKVLKAMVSSSYSMRSITGIAKDTGLAKLSVSHVISTLMRKGLVVQAQSSSGQPRWYPSAEGRIHAQIG
ncbi:MAG: hypothetical protein FAZ92_01424 [Accumulibacter sp.]|uniref:YEATS-associated helix-containing protein n=1 Tax=Accumulibacter sp. TaxID=2053492 RepID=UPI001200DECE|nr:YEATS-associated helix-containing protein [Accumulibacter sp.]TLD46313.1 MAG: hypothetical protein FAZ92_01424 [Accumulibacter sp.]